MEAVPPGAVHWQDAAFWADLSGEASGQFDVVLTDRGAFKSFVLRLWWLNEEGAGQYEDITIRASETDPNEWAADTPF
jgi:hypothetical protein